MSQGSRDKWLEQMLHAYELGLLDAEQQEAFELYLLEHDELFENVHGFERVSRLLRNSPKVREAIDQMAAEPDSGSAAGRRRGRVWRMLIPTSAAAIIILFALILKDWRFELGPSEEARAATNVLAVPCFVNLANPDDPHQVGEVLANLLITDLSQSTYLRVISSQRIEVVMSRLGYGTGHPPDLAAAVRVAKAAHATTILLGSVLQEDSILAVSIQLVEIETGRVSGALRFVGTPHEDIFSLVDRLTPRIKDELVLPRGAQLEVDPLVADMTTHSPDAYRYYIDGVDYLGKFDYGRAVMSFEHALEYDSSCAMAWYYLTMLKDRRLIDKAMQYADKTTRRDRYLIMSLRASLDGKVREAIKVLEAAVGEYPDDKDIRVRLGQYLYGIGDHRSAIDHYRAGPRLVDLSHAGEALLEPVQQGRLLLVGHQEPPRFGDQLLLLDRLTHGHPQLLEIAGLGKESVDLAYIDGVQGGVEIGQAGKQDPRRVGKFAAHYAQKRRPRHAGHRFVGHNHVDNIFLENPQRLLGRAGRENLVIF